MQTITLTLQTQPRQIPCHVGENLWELLSTFLQERFPRHALYVIADANVAHLYSDLAGEKLSSHPGFREMLTFPAGEQSKSRQQKDALEDSLLHRKAGRDTVLLAMGGGVTGDLAGYVAATLHRGIPLVHMPTSLLAMVDSSIGGKTGINHPAGKNLIGAFYQPEAIFCDVNFLKTLPRDEFLSGMGEVVKYAVTLNDGLWMMLEGFRDQILNLETVQLIQLIEYCVKTKIHVVSGDEKESGFRSVLNFGHTVGHAIEILANYTIPHGFAVAAGMKIAAHLSRIKLGYPQSRLDGLLHLLKSYDLDRVDISQFSIDDIWNCILTDKKSRQQAPRFSLMNAENLPELFYPIQKTELEHVLTLA